jgi:hypothetical protein
MPRIHQRSVRPVSVILPELNEYPSRVPIGRTATDTPRIVPGYIELDINGAVGRIEILRGYIGYL